MTDYAHLHQLAAEPEVAEHLEDEDDAVREEREALAELRTAETSPNPEGEHQRRVQSELQRIRVREEARQLFDLERSGTPVPIDASSLRDVLARPPEPTSRVAELIPWAGSTLVSAQRKTGKTLLLLNLADSLLAGHPFLNTFDVHPLTGNLTILNYEVSAAQLARWAADVGVDPDRCLLVNLRGRRNPLRHPDDRANLAERLRTHRTEALLVDPFGRAYTGLSQNDPGEVGNFLIDLELFARTEAGATDLILTAHAGWNGERTRGSSALEDWPDSIITMVKDAETGLRYLRAEGRDVDLDERELAVTGRTLYLSGSGSRKQAREAARWRDQEQVILDVLTGRTDALNTSELQQAVAGRGFQRGDVSRTCNRLLDKGLISCDPGPRGAKLWSRVVIELSTHEKGDRLA